MRAAVLADLLTGSSVTGTAKKHHVSKSLVVLWRQEAGIQSTVRTEKRDAIGQQLFDYLEASIATLGLQVRFFGERSFLEKQSAGELAILHGVIADKTVRLLSALRGDDGPVESPALPATPASGPA